MIHIATVHWQTDKWIDLQLHYLKQNIASPFKVYAFLNGIKDYHYAKYSFVCDEPLEDHGIKLNLLAKFISQQAADSDILIFLDGDAFPIAPLDSFLTATLLESPLSAILRKENLSDQQPHPSFCTTTIGFWNQINGDWKEGYCWKDQTGVLVTDIGGNLLKKLKDYSIDWKHILRTRSLRNHKLWYGIYDDIIYHHGAGFRDPLSRLDLASGPAWLRYYQYAVSKSRSLHVRLNRSWEKISIKRIGTKHQQEHDEMYSLISSNRDIFHQYLK